MPRTRLRVERCAGEAEHLWKLHAAEHRFGALRPQGMAFFYGCMGMTAAQVIENVKLAQASGANDAIIAAPSYICAAEADIEPSYLR